jgi:hypothetical protein
MAEASGETGTGGRTRSDPTSRTCLPERSTAAISITASFCVLPVVSRSMMRKRVGVSEELAMPYLGPPLGPMGRELSLSAAERLQVKRALERYSPDMVVRLRAVLLSRYDPSLGHPLAFVEHGSAT